GVGALLRATALAPAVGARRGDFLTRGAAALARAGGHHLPEDGLAHPPHLTRTPACRARRRGRPRPGAGRRARLARDSQAGAQVLVDAEHRLGELEVEHRLGVAPPPYGAPPALGLAEHRPAEERLEQVAQPAHLAEAERVLAAR